MSFAGWMSNRRKVILNEGNGSADCHYCGCILSNNELTLDHLKPRATHPHLSKNKHNIVPACFECNQAKRCLDDITFLKTIKIEQRVFPNLDKTGKLLTKEQIEFLGWILDEIDLENSKAALAA